MSLNHTLGEIHEFFKGSHSEENNHAFAEKASLTDLALPPNKVNEPTAKNLLVLVDKETSEKTVVANAGFGTEPDVLASIGDAVENRKITPIETWLKTAKEGKKPLKKSG